MLNPMLYLIYLSPRRERSILASIRTCIEYTRADLVVIILYFGLCCDAVKCMVIECLISALKWPIELLVFASDGKWSEV